MKLKYVQTLTSICQHPERSVATPFIRGLAPRVIEYLLMISSNKEQPAEPELPLILESIRLMEVLVAKAEDNTSKIILMGLTFSARDLSI